MNEEDFENGLDLLIPDVRNRSETLFEITEELKKESDRGCALVVAAYLENEITALLSGFLVKQGKKETKELFDFNGSMGTFSSKIKMAFSLGLISKEVCSSLNTVRKVRNEFAHLQKPLDFRDNKIGQHIDGLLPSSGISEPSSREKFIKKVQVMVVIIHMSLANTINREELEHEAIPLMENQNDHELEIAARRMMKITAPDITYEQAIEMAKKMREIK